MYPRLNLVLLLLAAFVLRTTAQSITIGNDRELQNMRNCGRDCMTGWGGMWEKLGCPNSNQCFCKDNVKPFASSYLESCIQTYFKTCTDGQEYATAMSIYDRYCTAGIPPPAIVTATLGAGGSSGGANGRMTVTVYTSAPTVTVFRSTSSGTRAVEEKGVVMSVVYFGALLLFTMYLRNGILS